MRVTLTAVNQPSNDSEIDHVLGVTKREGTTSWVSGHTSNYYDKRLSDVVNSYPLAHYSRLRYAYGNA